MFERFTTEARQIVVLAQEEARQLRHNYIGTEHLLLALLAQGEIAAARITSKGLDVGGARDRVANAIGTGQTEPVGHIPFTPRAKRVLELAGEAMRRLNHQDITPDHILLGLLRLADGTAYSLLVEAEISPDDLRKDLGAAIEGEPVSYLELALQALDEGSEALRALVVRDHEPLIDETLVRFVVGQRLSSLARGLTADVTVDWRETMAGRTVHLDLTVGDSPYVGMFIRYPRAKTAERLLDELTGLVATAREMPYPTLVVTLLADEQRRGLAQHEPPWPLQPGLTANEPVGLDTADTVTVVCLANHPTGIEPMYVFGVERRTGPHE